VGVFRGRLPHITMKLTFNRQRLNERGMLLQQHIDEYCEGAMALVSAAYNLDKRSKQCMIVLNVISTINLWRLNDNSNEEHKI
jgi:hypothetical protein